jgi:hypothetical protein
MKRVTLVLLALGACVDTKEPVAGTQSLRVDLLSLPGTEASRLPDTQRTVMFDVTALDAAGNTDTSFNNQVQVYANFLGTLTPYLGATPSLGTVQLNAGVATNVSVMLPEVYGPTTIFLDDGGAENPTYAVGASPTLWFRDPFISDIQAPTSETALDALTKSPLEAKQVTVKKSRHGANGRLVVTSVFAQGYTVSDVLCGAGGAPPCQLAPNPKANNQPGYDHAMVFSFSAARDEEGRLIREGQLIDGFAGGVSEFNGLTEISFPQSFNEAADVDINPARIPAPATFDIMWFTNKYMMERNEAAPIAVVNAKVCTLDSDYDKYKQWKLDPTGMGGDCKGNRNVLNVITNGIVPDDVVRSQLEGKTIPKVVGVLRPVNIGSFNVWIIYPRSMADLTL